MERIAWEIYIFLFCISFDGWILQRQLWRTLRQRTRMVVIKFYFNWKPFTENGKYEIKFAILPSENQFANICSFADECQVRVLGELKDSVLSWAEDQHQGSRFWGDSCVRDRVDCWGVFIISSISQQLNSILTCLLCIAASPRSENIHKR